MLYAYCFPLHVYLTDMERIYTAILLFSFAPIFLKADKVSEQMSKSLYAPGMLVK